MRCTSHFQINSMFGKRGGGGIAKSRHIEKGVRWRCLKCRGTSVSGNFMNTWCRSQDSRGGIEVPNLATVCGIIIKPAHDILENVYWEIGKSCWQYNCKNVSHVIYWHWHLLWLVMFGHDIFTNVVNVTFIHQFVLTLSPNRDISTSSRAFRLMVLCWSDASRPVGHEA